VWNGSQFVAVGDTGTSDKGCATSPDGVTWTARSGLATSIGSGVRSLFQSVAWNGSIFVAIGLDSTATASLCSTSSNGITWTYRSGFTSAFAGTQANAVRWNGSLFIAVGNSGACATSPDGVTWTAKSALAVAVGAIALNAVTYNTSKIITVGGSGKCATSP
jgi:hypothetical protein